jgi:hypothetical protein
MSPSLDQQQLRQQQQNQDQQEFLHTEPSSYYNDRSFGSERTAYSAYPPSFTSQTTKQGSLSANYKPGGGPDDLYAESRDSYSADGHHHSSTTNLRPNRGDGDVLEPPQPPYMSPMHDGRDSISDDGTASGTDDEFDWVRRKLGCRRVGARRPLTNERRLSSKLSFFTLSFLGSRRGRWRE